MLIDVMPISKHRTSRKPKTTPIVSMPAQMPKTGFSVSLSQMNFSG
jgi:hypothetical protein